MALQQAQAKHQAPTPARVKRPTRPESGPRSSAHQSRVMDTLTIQDAEAPPPGGVSWLYQRLRAARLHANKKQIEIAKFIGVTRPTVSMWEAPNPDIRSRPSIEKVRKYAECCGVPLTFLMDDSAHPDDLWRKPGSMASVTPSANPEQVMAPARHALLGMDRKAQNFWSAVEYMVTSKNAALDGCFMPLMEVAGMAPPDFMHGGHAAMFCSNVAERRSFVVAATGALLLLEQTRKVQFNKHLLVWARPDGTGPLDEAGTASMFGVTARQFETAEQAAKYILGLA